MEQFKHYQVDVEELDAEHLQIFAILENMKWKYTSVDDVLLHSLISQLQSILELHCENEEKYMESFDYPFLDAHKEAHVRLITTLNGHLVTIMKYKNSAKFVSDEIIKEFQNHIEWYDLQYSDYKKKQQDSLK